MDSTIDNNKTIIDDTIMGQTTSCKTNDLAVFHS